MNWTKLNSCEQVEPVTLSVNRSRERVSVITYVVPIGCRHCSKLGRLILNACIVLELFLLEFFFRKLQFS